MFYKELDINNSNQTNKIEAISPDCFGCGHYKPLTSVIEQQFKDWRLTNSESEIAFMLIKGLSLRAISQSRKTSESTVRLQALAIYSKANLAGRHELSSHFLEALLVPIPSLAQR